MNVVRLAILVGVKEESVRADAKDGRHSGLSMAESLGFSISRVLRFRHTPGNSGFYRRPSLIYTCDSNQHGPFQRRCFGSKVA
jgi:hypothetical protein